MGTQKQGPSQDAETPDQRLVTRRQAAYLSRIGNVAANELAGKTIAGVNDLLRWRIDPELLRFRRICGKVVKPNPVTGEPEPVPNATVHVEDTDCSFLGFFPVQNPYFWLFPFKCRREELATVVTDACGRFCVYLPYWDVDRYLRFRRERICFPELVRPNLRDILERPLFEEPRPPFPPRPAPDPAPLIDPDQIERIRAIAGPDIADRFEQVADLREMGAGARELETLLNQPAFQRRVPPPLPRMSRDRKTSLPEAIEPLASAAGDAVRDVNFQNYLGPFLRCRDVIVPVWHTLLDVPDLTFRVTQDVDGDGNEETIYSEGFFDVRWNAPGNLDVTLTANGNALSTPHCEPVEGIDCADQPAIVTAGYMPLEPTHHENAKGVAIRVNRPRPPDGRYSTPQASPGHAPYSRTLNLHGCHRLDGATHYRITHAVELAGTFTSPVPFTDLSWWAPRLGPGAPIHVMSDEDGWYPILPEADLAHPNWLLSWPTTGFANGLYELRLELGASSGGGISVEKTGDPERFLIDNTRPDLTFLEIRWRLASEPLSMPWTDDTSALLPEVCPVLTRPAGQAVHIRVAWMASAAHLRNAQLSASGCGAGGLSFVTGEDSFRHWHIDENDNSISEQAVLLLPGDRPAGCYHVRLQGVGRQFNPSGFDYGPASNWFINQGGFGLRHISRAISLVNA